MIKRTLESTLHRMARQYPVITLTGPRQSGKTTLVRQAFARHDYVSLEDPDQRGFAAEDPRGFLSQFSGPVILDEVQRAG
jgi:predicted AAA+ superfamily ATPase